MSRPLLIVLALLSLPVEALAGNDYPTVARADYVLGCMAANGNTRIALEKCACALDSIAERGLGLHPQRRLGFLVACIGQQLGDRIQGAGAFLECDARIAVRRHAADNVVCPRGCRIAVIGRTRRRGYRHQQRR